MISPRPPAGAETLKTDRRPDRKTKLTNATTSTIIPFIYPIYPQFAQMRCDPARSRQDIYVPVGPFQGLICPFFIAATAIRPQARTAWIRSAKRGSLVSPRR